MHNSLQSGGPDPGAKRKRDSEEDEQGAAYARDFLTKFVALPVEDLNGQAQDLYKGLEDRAATNPYLARLLEIS